VQSKNIKKQWISENANNKITVFFLDLFFQISLIYCLLFGFLPYSVSVLLFPSVTTWWNPNKKNKNKIREIQAKNFVDPQNSKPVESKQKSGNEICHHQSIQIIKNRFFVWISSILCLGFPDFCLDLPFSHRIIYSAAKFTIFHVNSREFTKFHTFSLSRIHKKNSHFFTKSFFLPVWTANKAKNSLSWAFSQKIFYFSYKRR
jgi:hypothetical protein